jgi:hypothetical protein
LDGTCGGGGAKKRNTGKGTRTALAREIFFIQVVARIVDQVERGVRRGWVCLSTVNRLDNRVRVFYDASKWLTVKQLALAEGGGGCS